MLFLKYNFLIILIDNHIFTCKLLNKLLFLKLKNILLQTFHDNYYLNNLLMMIYYF
jgi:hypothetical protein